MEALLLELLHRLEAIGVEHEELFDDRAEEARSEVLFHGFLKLQADEPFPESFGMSTKEGDRLVRDVLGWFLPRARQAAQQEGLDTFHKRFAALRNKHIHTEEWSDTADFFGWWWDASDFDEHGNRHN